MKNKQSGWPFEKEKMQDFFWNFCAMGVTLLSGNSRIRTGNPFHIRIRSRFRGR